MEQRDDERPATTNLMPSVRPPAPAEERPATEQQPSILAGSIWEAKLAENQRVTTVDIKQFLSYNKEVYEKNIMDDYREQAVLRALNRQRLQMCRLRNLETFRASNEQRRQFEASVGNPFVWRKQRLELEAQMMEEALKHERPAFSDLEELEPLMQASQMKQRGLRLPNPMAAILSPRDMMRMHEARVKVPDLGSLMNPRNQMTSPVPDKQQLLASLGLAPQKRVRGWTMAQLLVALPGMCEQMQAELAAAQMQRRPRKPLTQLFYNRVVAEFGLPGIARKRLEQLRTACAAHGHHPRVRIFAEMAELRPPERPDAPPRWSDGKLDAFLTLWEGLAPFHGAAAASAKLHDMSSAAQHRPSAPSSPRAPSTRSPRAASPRLGTSGSKDTFATGRRPVLEGLYGHDVKVIENWDKDHTGEVDGSQVAELPLELVEGLLQRCQKKGLLPEDIHTVDKVKLQLRELASALVLPERPPHMPPREEAVIDADRFLCSWMDAWERWDEDLAHAEETDDLTRIGRAREFADRSKGRVESPF